MTTGGKVELISVDEYLARELRSDIRHEYLGGYVYAMAGARNVHTIVATSCLLALGFQLRGKSCQPLNSDAKVRVRMMMHTRFYYPDAMVVCEPNSPDATFQDNPVVIAEVVSEATRRIDEGEKREAYLTIPTLMAYLVIETDRPRVVVHRRTAHGGFAAEVHQGLDAVIPLEMIEARLPLGELYERVNFETAPPRNH